MKPIDFTQPIVLQRADPFIYKHTDGYYYFTASVPGYKSIELRRARELEDLQYATPMTIWTAHSNGPQSELIWAPEIHFIDDKWYIYYAASDHLTLRDHQHHHRMFVIENLEMNPLNQNWIEKGQIITELESFSLDGTVFKYQSILYYVWAQQDPSIAGNSNLYISKMKNPWTLAGKTTLLSIPEFDWEKQGFMVNEGPAVIIKKDKLFITYSASATDENYCIGLLWCYLSQDFLDRNSWHKIEIPLFSSSDKYGLYGPGHNSFTTNTLGEDLIVFHARPEKNKQGDPLNNPNRHTHIKILDWDKEGFPIIDQATYTIQKGEKEHD